MDTIAFFIKVSLFFDVTDRKGRETTPYVKSGYHNIMITTPKTTQEKRALKFAVDLLNRHGYGYTITVPYTTLSQELSEKGTKISLMTVIAYWKALERMGYVTRVMGARINGVTHKLNRYAFRRLTK